MRLTDERVPSVEEDTVVCAPPAGSRREIFVVCAAIVLAAITVYWNGLSAPFVFDDEEYVTNNQAIRRLWPPWPVLSHAGNPVAGRPLFNLSLAANYALGGTDVRGYHALSLAVHVLAALTLFGLLRRTFLRPSLRARFGPAALRIAAAVALLWTVHPLQTKAVIYVGQRPELLAGLFYLLVLYCLVRGLETGASRAWHVAAVIACLLGMGSKEVMASAPLAALLYDRAFAAGSLAGAWRLRWRLYLGLAATWAPLGWLVTQRFAYGPTADFTSSIAWTGYAWEQVGAIVHYLRLSVWPHPLVFDYGPYATAASTTGVLLRALLFALLAAGTVVALWRRPALGFLGASFFMILAPSSSVVPIGPELLGEHRMYLALAPVMVLVVLAVSERPPRWRAPLFLALLVTAALLAARRTEDYRSALAIWGDTVAKREGNPRAHNNLGNALLEDGRAEQALAHYRRAAAIQPGSVLANTNLGVALVRLGRDAEAAAQFRAVLAARPGSAEAHNGLGAALGRLGRKDESIAHYRRALQIDPAHAVAFNNLVDALVVNGQADEAIALWQRAGETRPLSAGTQSNLAIALVNRGRAREAIALWQRAVAAEPSIANARCYLGYTLWKEGRAEEGISQLRTALGSAAPQCARGAIRAVAWEMATSPVAARRNGARAVELAEEVSRLAGDATPEDGATLAAAYAEAGRFVEAAATAERALRLAAARNDTALAASIRRHRERYRAGAPLREGGLPVTPPAAPDGRP